MIARLRIMVVCEVCSPTRSKYVISRAHYDATTANVMGNRMLISYNKPTVYLYSINLDQYFNYVLVMHSHTCLTM